MNHTFHFSRIKLLFIRYFTEHWRRELVAFSAIFIVLALLPRLAVSSIPALPFILFCMILLFRGMHFSAHIFTEIHYTSSGMHYLHIPASGAEKFFVNGFLSLILFPLLCFALFYGATLFGNLLEPIMPSMLHYKVIDMATLIPSTNVGMLSVTSDPFGSSSSTLWAVISSYIFLQSIFFLGSLFFKKHPTTKTIVTVMVFSLALGIVQMVLAKVIWSGVNIESLSMVKEKLILLGTKTFGSRTVMMVDQVCHWALVLFFWVVSYLKLKEKEI